MKRDLNRKKFFDSDGIKATVFLESLNKAFSGCIVDMTPYGFGILVYQNIPEQILSEVCKIQIDKGQNFPITLSGVIVNRTQNVKNGVKYVRLGISILQKDLHKTERKSERLPVSQFFPPTASSAHPLLFCETMFFRVVDFSPKGMGLVTSLANKVLLKGLNLDLNLHLPKVGTSNVNVEIRNVVLQQDRFLLNTIFKPPALRIHDSICRYLLLCDGSLSPKILKRMGFRLTNAITAMFDYATLADLDEICKLRHAAYGVANPNIVELDPKDMLDRFDENARHLIYRANGKIIAAARAIFNNGIKSNSEIFGKYSAILDVDIWEEPFIEISKYCVSPHYRNTDLANSLLNQVFRIAFESGNQSIVATCEPKLFNYWKKIGYHQIGQPFELSEHKTVLIPIRGSIRDLIQNDFCKDLRDFLNYAL